jgi:hypothetical protein
VTLASPWSPSDYQRENGYFLLGGCLGRLTFYLIDNTIKRTEKSALNEFV